jgi:type II secretory pathway component PulL
MTRKALLIFTAIVVAVLFSFTTFAQVQGQEAAAESSVKTVSYSDLMTQKKKIDDLKTSYAQLTAEYDAECKGKDFKSDKAGQKKCNEKSVQLTNTYNELKKEMEAYNKNLAQYKGQANKAQTSPDATGSSSQNK